MAHHHHLSQGKRVPKLPFDKHLRTSVFDVNSIAGPDVAHKWVKGPVSPGGIRAIGHESADEQLVSVAGSHM